MKKQNNSNISSGFVDAGNDDGTNININDITISTKSRKKPANISIASAGNNCYHYLFVA